MVWLGGIAVLVVFGFTARNRDPAFVTRFIGSLRYVGLLVLGPAMVGVLEFGIWLVLDTDHRVLPSSSTSSA
jgi:hypothetical protein